MMYIEHLVLLAGAYNLGFFIFLFFVLQVQRRETVIIASPGSRFGSGYPRHLK